MDKERRALPEGWEWKRLGEILELIRNGISTKQNEEKEGYPVTRIETISKGKINREKIGYVREDYNTILKYKMISGDILFSHINSAEHIGKTAIFENELDELYQGVNLLLLRPNKGIVFPKYLLFYLKEPEVRKYFETRCKKAVNQASLNQKDIIQIKIPFPPLPTQRRVVSILEKAEETTRLRAQADELTDRMLQSVFLEMFGDPFKNTMNWPITEIGKVCNVTKLAGFEYTNYVKYSDHGEIIMIRGLNVKNCKLKLDNVKYIDKKTSYFLHRSKLFKDEIIMTYIGVNIGDVALIPESEKYHLAPNVAKISSLDKNVLNPVYLVRFLDLEQNKLQFKKFTTNTAKQALNMANIRKLTISIPPIELQQKFARIVERVESMRQSQNQSKQHIEDLFNTIMQKAFKGELTQ